MPQIAENCLTGCDIRRVRSVERVRIDSGDGLFSQPYSPAMTRPVENSYLETVPSSQDFMGTTVDPLESRIKGTNQTSADYEVTPKRNREEEGSLEVVSHGKPPKIQRTEDSASKKTRKKDAAQEKNAERKSKRRSSFVRGRISQVFGILEGGTSTSPLETSAPGEDPEVRLCKEAMQQALLSVRTDELNLTRWHEFEVEVAHEVCESIERLRGTGFAKEENSDSQESSSLETNAIDESIIKCKSFTEKLKAEGLSWDGLCEDWKRTALEAERQSQQAEVIPITGPVGSLSPEMEAQLKSLPNYAAFAEEIRHSREAVLLCVDKYLRVTAAVQKFKSAATAYIHQQAQLMREKTFSAMEDYDDPKTIVEKILAIQSDADHEKM